MVSERFILLVQILGEKEGAREEDRDNTSRRLNISSTVNSRLNCNIIHLGQEKDQASSYVSPGHGKGTKSAYTLLPMFTCSRKASLHHHTRILKWVM